MPAPARPPTVPQIESFRRRSTEFVPDTASQRTTGEVLAVRSVRRQMGEQILLGAEAAARVIDDAFVFAIGPKQPRADSVAQIGVEHGFSQVAAQRLVPDRT